MNALLLFLTALMVALKLGGVIDASWWLVLSPIWVPLLINWTIAAVVLIFLALPLNRG